MAKIESNVKTRSIQGTVPSVTTSPRATAIPKSKKKTSVRHNGSQTAATRSISGRTEALVVQHTPSHRATAILDSKEKTSGRRNRSRTAATASISGRIEALVTKSQTTTASFPEAEKVLEVRQTRSQTAVSQAGKFARETARASRIPKIKKEPVVGPKRNESTVASIPEIEKVVRPTRNQKSNILLLHVSVHFVFYE